MLRYTNSGLISFITVDILIATIYGCFIHFYVRSVAKFYSVFAYTLLGFATLFVVMIVWSLFMASFTEPGYVAIDEGMEDTEQEEFIKDETRKMKDELLKNKKLLEKKDDNKEEVEFSRDEIVNNIREARLKQMRTETYCFSCNQVRPIRAHHCKMCGRCVERMDHHCVFIGNCVGAKNLRFFLQFTGYVGFTLIVILLIAFVVFVVTWPDIGTGNIIGIFVICGYGWITGLGVLALFIYTLRVTFINLTSLEDNVRGIRKLRPFDKGTKANFKEAFGEGIRFYHIIFPLPIK